VICGRTVYYSRVFCYFITLVVIWYTWRIWGIRDTRTELLIGIQHVSFYVQPMLLVLDLYLFNQLWYAWFTFLSGHGWCHVSQLTNVVAICTLASTLLKDYNENICYLPMGRSFIFPHSIWSVQNARICTFLLSAKWYICF